MSRVLNGNYPVAATTRERVLRAVDELDYVLNGPASALAAATSDLVGILVNDIADPFFGIMASAIQGEIGGPGAARAGNGWRWCATRGLPGARADVSDPVAAAAGGGGRADRRRDGERAARGGGRGEAAETGGGGDAGGAVRAAAGAGHRGVRADLRQPRGGRELTEHLIGLGHRRLGYIAGPEERTTTRHRLEGHREALVAHGIVEDPRWTVHGRYDRRSGYEATLELLRRDPSLTAVVAANDSVAVGASAALRESGRRIPDDVSVAGFDDLPFSVDAVPSLTTVRLPLSEAGARAGRIAMGREEPPPGGIATVRGS